MSDLPRRITFVVWSEGHGLLAHFRSTIVIQPVTMVDRKYIPYVLVTPHFLAPTLQTMEVKSSRELQARCRSTVQPITWNLTTSMALARGETVALVLLLRD